MIFIPEFGIPYLTTPPSSLSEEFILSYLYHGFLEFGQIVSEEQFLVLKAVSEIISKSYNFGAALPYGTVHYYFYGKSRTGKNQFIMLLRRILKTANFDASLVRNYKSWMFQLIIWNEMELQYLLEELKSIHRLKIWLDCDPTSFVKDRIKEDNVLHLAMANDPFQHNLEEKCKSTPGITNSSKEALYNRLGRNEFKVDIPLSTPLHCETWDNPYNLYPNCVYTLSLVTHLLERMCLELGILKTLHNLPEELEKERVKYLQTLQKGRMAE